jgi:hypothetical protein
MESLVSEPSIKLPQSYELSEYILGPVMVTYFGLYVMISNHFIFKPKVEQILRKTMISSVALQQFIVDFLSNISIITFLFNEVILLNSDRGISVMIYNDMFWTGICMSILAYRSLK